MSVFQASRKEPQRRADLLGLGRGGDRSERRWRHGRSYRRRREARTKLRTPDRGAGGAMDVGERRGWSCGRPTEAWTELQTPARGADEATDAGEGDLEAGRRRLRERAAGARNAAATPTGHSLTLLLTLMGQQPGGPNSLAGPNFSPTELVVRLV